MFDDFLGSCENHWFLTKTGQATFWAAFGKTWATFYFNIWSHCYYPSPHEYTRDVGSILLVTWRESFKAFWKHQSDATKVVLRENFSFQLNKMSQWYDKYKYNYNWFFTTHCTKMLKLGSGCGAVDRAKSVFF